jgi:hypothetical protein
MTTSDRLRRLAGQLRLAVVLLGIGLLLAGAGVVWVAYQTTTVRNCDGGWFNYAPNSGFLYSPNCSPSVWSYAAGGAFLLLAIAALLLPTYALVKALPGIATALEGGADQDPAVEV